MFIWKDIPEYEGLYQISSHGDVREVKVKYLNPSGGCIVLTTKSKSRVNVSIQKIVNLAFVKHKICKGPEIWDNVPFNDFNFYEVSNYGNIRVCRKKVLRPNNGKVVLLKKRGGKKRRECIRVIKLFRNSFPI